MKKMTLFVSVVISCLLCGCSAEKPMDVSGSGVHFDGVVDGVSQKVAKRTFFDGLYGDSSGT